MMVVSGSVSHGERHRRRDATRHERIVNDGAGAPRGKSAIQARMSVADMPAVALAAVPGRRRATLDLAREIERRGFSGIYCASFGDGLGLCEALALATSTI